EAASARPGWPGRKRVHGRTLCGPAPGMMSLYQSRGEHALYAAYLAEQVLAHRAVGVDERVGVLAAGLVEQVSDVEARRGEAGGYLADHVGHVAVRDREPRRARDARQHRLRIIH